MNKGPSASLRQSREDKRLKANFRFWYETKSGNQIATEFMNKDEAATWLQTNQCYIVGIQILNRMTNKEVKEYLK